MTLQKALCDDWEIKLLELYDRTLFHVLGLIWIMDLRENISALGWEFVAK